MFRSPALLPMSRTHAGSQKEARRAAEAAAAAKCVHQHRHQQQHQWKSQITARQHIDARDRLSETQARRDSRDSGASVCATQAGRHTDLLRARSGSAFTKWKWGVGLSYGVKSYTLR